MPGAGTRPLRRGHPADRVERGLQLCRIERERDDIVGAGPDQLADECQRRLIAGGDQRHRPLRQFLEALHGVRTIAIDLDHGRRRAGQHR